jgi:hypothetical protein
VNVITGFNITRNGKFGSGVYTNEAHALEKLAEYREKNPNDQFYLQPTNIYIPDEDETHFGFRRFQGEWHLEHYMGMGDTNHFQMSDADALMFADSVYARLGKMPGDCIKATVDLRIEEAQKALAAAKRELTK